MNGELTITTEQVDDFPVLIAQMEHMTVPNLLDRHFTVHGNWQGLSLGWTGTAWLGHILSVGDLFWLLDSFSRYFGIFDANLVRSRLCLLTGSTLNDAFFDNKQFIGGFYKIEIVFG